MEPFTALAGVAVPLPLSNVDTDLIFPAQHAGTVERTGLGRYLFSGLRYREDGSENPDFVLNKPAYRAARILIAGDNFGCGSSREHAPWALLDFGIRCVIAPSFADIFRANCYRNGMLPVALPAPEVDALMRFVAETPGTAITVDLVSETVAIPGGRKFPFRIEPDRRDALLLGLDEVGASLARMSAIERFERAHWDRRPWLRRPSGGADGG